MKQKIKKITKISAPRIKNGRTRFTLMSGSTWHCVYVCPEGQTTCPITVGTKVVAVERIVPVGQVVDADGKITTAGVDTAAWYFDQVHYEGFIQDQVEEDVDYLIAQFKANQLNAMAKSVTTKSIETAAI